MGFWTGFRLKLVSILAECRLEFNEWLLYHVSLFSHVPYRLGITRLSVETKNSGRSASLRAEKVPAPRT